MPKLVQTCVLKHCLQEVMLSQVRIKGCTVLTVFRLSEFRVGIGVWAPQNSAEGLSEWIPMAFWIILLVSFQI